MIAGVNGSGAVSRPDFKLHHYRVNPLLDFSCFCSTLAPSRPRVSLNAMDGDETEGVEMKDLTSTSFGYIIAFLLPGLLGIYALSFWSSDVVTLLTPAFKADATVGPSLIIVLMALGVGFCVSALRFYLFERVLCTKHGFPPDTFAKLSRANKLNSFREVFV